MPSGSRAFLVSWKPEHTLDDILVPRLCLSLEAQCTSLPLILLPCCVTLDNLSDHQFSHF